MNGDPEMASWKKAQTWHFSIKVYVVTDKVVGITTNAVYGLANEHHIVRTREALLDDTR